jgi:predicted transcriptional regulator of viral defense system
MKKGFLHTLLRLKQSVFTFRELMLLWGGTDRSTAKARVHYYVKTHELYHLRRGIYAKDRAYDPFELASRIVSPSYISFETVLGARGITFQYYDRIFVASYISKEIMVDGHPIVFKTLKRDILTNNAGIEHREGYAIASLERAFLDTVYLNKQYHFDNLVPLDWEKIHAVLPIYGGVKRMESSIHEYQMLSKKMGRNQNVTVYHYS